MEGVLDVYTSSYDEGHVLVCMDETSKQHIIEVRQPVNHAPGREYRYDAWFFSPVILVQKSKRAQT
jgi:hypothetical protein